MSKPGYKDLGISSKEYEEALLLERLFKLVKKNPCSTCLLKKPTHVDLDRFDLVCTNCSKRCSSKIQIGKGVISMADLERLEAIYDKSKKKTDRQSASKKHGHTVRSPSVSSSHSRTYKKYTKHTHSDSGSEIVQRNRSKRRSKKKDTHRHQSHHDHYTESYDKYPQVRTSAADGYPKMYQEERYSPHFKPHRERRSRDMPMNRSRDMSMGRSRDMGMDKHKNRDYDLRRDHDMNRENYSHHPSYSYYNQPRYQDRYMDSHQPSYQQTGMMKRTPTTYDYPMHNRRDVPGMMGIMSNHAQPNGMVFRNQLALPPPEKNYSREKNSQSLALTNGFQAFRSLPPVKNEPSVSNNPFSKRTYDQAPKPYDFSHMRDALIPPKSFNTQSTLNRYQESYYPRDFSLNKLGNPGFPDSGPNYYNRY